MLMKERTQTTSAGAPLPQGLAMPIDILARETLNALIAGRAPSGLSKQPTPRPTRPFGGHVNRDQILSAAGAVRKKNRPETGRYKDQIGLLLVAGAGFETYLPGRILRIRLR